jgi:hypothetical protein
MDESYFNAYLLIIGATTYEELAEHGLFYLPNGHDDPDVLLRYFESIQEYEKCQDIKEYADNRRRDSLSKG